MLGYVEAVCIYYKKKYSLSRQGEACKDKIDASKTLRGVWLPTVLVNFGFLRVFVKNQHVGPSFTEMFVLRKQFYSVQWVFREYFCENESFSKTTFSLFIRGPGGLDS